MINQDSHPLSGPDACVWLLCGLQVCDVTAQLEDSVTGEDLGLLKSEDKVREVWTRNPVWESSPRILTAHILNALPPAGSKRRGGVRPV